MVDRVILWADGFGHYGDDTTLKGSDAYRGYIDNQNNNPANYALDTALPRTGLADIQIPSGTNYNRGFYKILGGTRNTMGLVIAIYMNSLPTSETMGIYLTNSNRTFVWGAGGGCQLMICITPAGTIKVFRGYKNALLGESGVCIAGGQYNSIEVRAKCDNTAGSVEILVNSLVVLAISSVDTQDDPTSNNLDMFAFGGMTYGNAYPTQYLHSDLVVYENIAADPIGDVRCVTLLPTSDGPAQDWTVTGAASAHAAVGTTPKAPTTRNINVASSGKTANFGHGVVPTDTLDVRALVMVTSLGKDDSGGCTIQPAIVSGAGVVLGDDIAPGVGDAFYYANFEYDPDGNPWTPATANASLMQVTRTS